MTMKMLRYFWLGLFLANLLPSIHGRDWVKLLPPDNATYDIDDVTDIPELIQADEIQVNEQFNRLVETMERDMDQFQENFRNLIQDTHSCAHRSVAKQEELKLSLKPELHHQYGMLFNHNSYMMPGLQSLQLFLAIDLPKIADLQHTPPPFPNCTTWAVPFPPQMKAYETMGSAYVAWTVYRELSLSLFWMKQCITRYVSSTKQSMIISLSTLTR